MKKNNKSNYYCNDKKDMISFALWLLKRMDIKLYQSKLYFKSNGKYISDDRLLLKNINHFFIWVSPFAQNAQTGLFYMSALA